MSTKLVPFDKTQLQLINRRFLRYGLSDAEKDYFLATVSQLIFKSVLRKKLVFKGGTALNHCYLDQLRFSEDLDFTSLEKNITLEEVKKVLESVEFLKVKKELFFGYILKNGKYIAEKEKALLDQLYMVSMGKRSINIEELDLRGMDIGKLIEYAKKFPNFINPSLDRVKFLLSTS